MASRRNSAARHATFHRHRYTGSPTLRMEAYLYPEGTHGSIQNIKDARINAPDRLGGTIIHKSWT